ncbi:SGNH/GDSL hydrolase family protein [Arthrobacter bambusae]|uniref:Lysophospholipase L1-like esterase n=1 Tax=Arthrobacter bambusae TaxID=1338426 RepID=A0AAW8DIL4_9MICC|nr:SGNH/GDSL hydrolase family protein [Arthrobacter bambusae]MDP9905395.1 lysophospholipase L1-like esterase [Arthrobacter bambusae]MDQ0129127.1 lysophospholipase L1-like esterase [Arthrobacter bambusae]MDQ0180527.1 lysophospholipase L1-like esterase [Arthrobacter bambusae]
MNAPAAGPPEDGSVGSGARLHPWSRYVALGDSFTEGVGDPEPRSPGGLRGWADRVAEELSAGHADFAYANLAVRGRLLHQILDEQIAPALALQPDLITLNGGGNDLIFHRTDPDKLAAELDAGVQLLASTGATVVLFAGPDWGTTPVLGHVRGKVAIFNENLRTIAARHDAVIADLWALRQLTHPRMWDPDRLHFSPLGQHTIAIMVLETLNVPHTLEPMTPKELPARSWREARADDIIWTREHLVPWVLQHLTHRSSEEERRAKRPDPGPVFGARMPPGTFIGNDPRNK